MSTLLVSAVMVLVSLEPSPKQAVAREKVSASQPAGRSAAPTPQPSQKVETAQPGRKGDPIKPPWKKDESGKTVTKDEPRRGPEKDAPPTSPPPALAIYEASAPAVPVNAIDRAVFPKLAELKIQPVLCSDAVFVRRVYIDVLGTLPTAQEAREFIQDKDKDKRRKLIDRLLARDEFADYWAMKWGDALRIKAEFPVNLWPNAAQAYHRWVRESIAANKPYDRFVRELLTSSGSNFRVPPVNFYRAIQNRTPEGIASAVALAFMGARTDHWPAGRLAGVSVFFSQIGYKPTREWKEENVFWDPLGMSPSAAVAPAPPPPPTPGAKPAEAPAAPATRPSGPLKALLPDGTPIYLVRDRDPREVFADWLITPRNPWFTRSIANRVWDWLLGRGVVHESDDIRDNNPPSNPELMACLEKELLEGKYDLKRLYRLILNSSTYQFSSTPRHKSPQAEAQFAVYPLRRLDAEVLIDAVNKVAGTYDLYTSPIPEPFTYIPKDMTAIAIADGSITSPFLALFGRSARATGMSNERDNRQVPAQWLHMLNSSHIQRKLEQGPRLKEILNSKRPAEEIITELYLTVLSRFPTDYELKVALDYRQPGTPDKSGKAARLNYRRYEDGIDITWSLINSTEFLYRH